MIPNWLYSVFFLVLIAGWPFAILDISSRGIDLNFWVMLLINSIVIVLVWHYNSVPVLPFFKGLTAICSSMMSGCANITLLYLPFVFFFLYVVILANTLVGLFRGREYTQEKWVKIVAWFVQHRIRH